MWYQKVCQKGGAVFIGLEATDNDLAALDMAQGVKTIGFDVGPNSAGAAHITDAGLSHLAHLHELEFAEFGELTAITNKGLTNLAGLQRLRGLRFEGNKNITDAGLQQFSNLLELRTLTFFGAPITDRGLTALIPLQHLEDLQLGNAHITNAGIDIIARFHELKTLDLQGTQVTDGGIGKLTANTKLEWLCLGSKITNTGLQRLVPLKNRTHYHSRTALDTRQSISIEIREPGGSRCR